MQFQNSAYRRGVKRSKSSTSIEDLESALDRLITELVAHRQRRKKPAVKLVSFSLDQLAKVPLTKASDRAKDGSFDEMIKRSMAKVGRQLAEQLTFNELYDLVERVANSDRENFGARLTPLCSAFVGIQTRDGARWVS